MGNDWRDPPKHPRSPADTRGESCDCCAMVAAARSVKRRKWRLARRYAVLSVRLIAARIS